MYHLMGKQSKAGLGQKPISVDSTNSLDCEHDWEIIYDDDALLGQVYSGSQFCKKCMIVKHGCW